MNPSGEADLPTLPALPWHGGCLCGAVGYEITALPHCVYSCNCTNCQKQSGSAFAMTMPVPRDDFAIVRGTLTPWCRTMPSGRNATSWSCGACACRIYGESEGRPQIVTVRAGTLEDTSWLRPSAHFFMRSAQPWICHGPETLTYEEQVTDFTPVIQAWRNLYRQD